jgi:hypothetical protein
VAKDKNPPSVAQARGIEILWSNYKRKYSALRKTPKKLRGFKQIWSKISFETAAEIGISCINHGYQNLIKIGYKGITGSMDTIS